MATAQTTHQLRCHVRKAGHARLDEVCRMLNTLYNAALQERRDAWRMRGVHISLYDQTAELTQVRADWPEWAGLDVNIARGVLRRLNRAMEAFFRRVKEGGAPGFPRFKPISRFRCIELSQVSPGMVKIIEGGDSPPGATPEQPRPQGLAQSPIETSQPAPGDGQGRAGGAEGAHPNQGPAGD